MLRACFALDLGRFLVTTGFLGTDDQLATRVDELAERVAEVDRLSRK